MTRSTRRRDDCSKYGYPESWYGHWFDAGRPSARAVTDVYIWWIRTQGKREAEAETAAAMMQIEKESQAAIAALAEAV